MSLRSAALPSATSCSSTCPAHPCRWRIRTTPLWRRQLAAARRVDDRISHGARSPDRCSLRHRASSSLKRAPAATGPNTDQPSVACPVLSTISVSMRRNASSASASREKTDAARRRAATSHHDRHRRHQSERAPAMMDAAAAFGTRVRPRGSGPNDPPKRGLASTAAPSTISAGSHATQSARHCVGRRLPLRLRDHLHDLARTVRDPIFSCAFELPVPLIVARSGRRRRLFRGRGLTNR